MKTVIENDESRDEDLPDDGPDDFIEVNLGDDDEGQSDAEADAALRQAKKALDAGGDDEEEDDPPAKQDPEDDEREEEEEEEVDPDLLPYSAKVRKRIQREQKLKEEERARRVKAERETEELRAKLQEAEQQHESSTIDARLDEAKKALSTARYDSDMDKEAEALATLTKLQVEKQRHGERKPVEKAKDAEPNEHLDRWFERNSTWFDDKKYSAQKAAALAINRELAEEGLDDASPTFYRELDKRLRERVKLPERAKPPPTVLSRSVEGRQQSKTKVILDKTDFAFMRKIGLDPANKTHLKAYATEKANG